MTRKEAYKTIKENLCGMCAYGSQCMESCDISSCDNRDAMKTLEQEPKIVPIAEIKFDDDKLKELVNKAVLTVAPQEPRWIPVNERLPEENKTVIASTKYAVYPEARYSKEDGWEWAYESGADYWEEIACNVLAWMPLPQPYKAESEG